MAKILLIEDDKFLRELITQKLSAQGFDVLEALNGEEGLKKITEEKPDAVLLDLVLPGIDGFDVLAKAKGNPATSAIPILILSNLGEREDVGRGMALGAADFLVKAQFTPGEIVDKIKAVLKQA